MRTKGRTSSCGGGASMTTAVPPGRISRKYLRNEASPASKRSAASPQPARRTKSARSLSRSEAGKAGFSLQIGAPSVAFNGKCYREPVPGQECRQPLRPFDERDTIGTRLLPAQFEHLLGCLQAVKIEMPVHTGRRLVDLGQGEGGAGHDQRRIARSGAQDGTGERGFADAQPALQGHDVARPQAPGEGGPQPFRGGFVRQGKRKSRHRCSRYRLLTRCPPACVLWVDQ